MSDLPNFKFDLENAKGWSGAGGTAKQHTVNEFPVSTSFAAVSMRSSPARFANCIGMRLRRNGRTSFPGDVA